jgi:hypothetical protein
MKILELLSEAPTLGAPTALQKLANVGQKPATQTTGPGLLGGLAQGFKQGMGLDPTDSLAKGVALKGLQATGMNQTANALAGSSKPAGQQQQQDGEENPQDGSVQGTGTTPPAGKMPLPGSIIKDPKYGNIKVLPTAPGQKGVHLDTTKVLGFPIYVDPKDLQR